MTLSLREGQRRFAEWRAQKQTLREPIPEELWELAVALTKTYSQQKVAQELRLNTGELSRRRKSNHPQEDSSTSATQSCFVELNLSSPPSSGQCHRIEIERYDGHRMTLCALPNKPFHLQEAIELFLGQSDASAQRSKQNLFSSGTG